MYRTMKFPLVFLATCSTMTTTTTSLANIVRPRILCLHGANQSATAFSQKIGGARRKLNKKFDLVFVDGPVERGGGRAWWTRRDHDDDDDGDVERRASCMREVAEFVRREAVDGRRPRDRDRDFDAVLGFSQGGTLATALAVSGALRVRAVVTAGAPYVADVLSAARDVADGDDAGANVPKLHLAGETDAIVPMESVERLCEEGGCGTMLRHEQGHLFPTRAAVVNEVMDFLTSHLSEEAEDEEDAS